MKEQILTLNLKLVAHLHPDDLLDTGRQEEEHPVACLLIVYMLYMLYCFIDLLLDCFIVFLFYCFIV